MHFALVDYLLGAMCAVHQSRTPGPGARWERVTPGEYADLLSGGFRVCMSWTGPKEDTDG